MSASLPVGGRLFHTEHFPSNAAAAQARAGVRARPSTLTPQPRAGAGAPPALSRAPEQLTEEQREARIALRAQHLDHAAQLQGAARRAAADAAAREREEAARNQARLHGPTHNVRRTDYRTRLAGAEARRDAQLRDAQIRAAVAADSRSGTAPAALAAPPPRRPAVATAAAAAAGAADADMRRAVQRSLEDAQNGGINDAAFRNGTGANAATQALPLPLHYRPQPLPLADHHLIPEGEICCICLMAFEAGQNNIVETRCGHLLHRVCSQQVFARGTRCPWCRHDQREAPRCASPLRKNGGAARRASFRMPDRHRFDELPAAAAEGSRLACIDGTQCDESAAIAASAQSHRSNNTSTELRFDYPSFPRQTNNNSASASANDGDDDAAAATAPTVAPAPRTRQRIPQDEWSLPQLLRRSGLHLPNTRGDEEDDASDESDSEAARNEAARREAMLRDHQMRLAREKRGNASASTFDDCRTRAEVGYVRNVQSEDVGMTSEVQRQRQLLAGAVVLGATTMNAPRFSASISFFPEYVEPRLPAAK